MLEYASKFMELSHFSPTYVTDERLKMNRFGAGFSLGLKEKMVARHYTSHEDMYDTTVNV